MQCSVEQYNQSICPRGVCSGWNSQKSISALKISAWISTSYRLLLYQSSLFDQGNYICSRIWQLENMKRKPNICFIWILVNKRQHWLGYLWRIFPNILWSNKMLRPGVKVSYLTQSSPAGIKSVNIVNADTFYLSCCSPRWKLTTKNSILLIEQKSFQSNSPGGL